MANENAAAETPKSNLLVDLLPNQLDQFELPTYHFKLFMMGDKAAAEKDFGPNTSKDRLVIAESGVTSTQIDDVVIESVVGPTKLAGMGISNHFSFTLTQPFGATLIDEIVDAADFLGIQNFAKAPFFLELSFVASGSVEDADAMAQSKFRDLVWVWPLQFTDMAMDVNTGGSTYNIQAVIYGDTAYANHISDLGKPISINAETVGEFFTNLTKDLNAREEEKKDSPGYQFVDTFEFKVHEDIVNEKIVPESKEDQQNRAATFEVVDSKMRISFPPGTSIERMVFVVLASTKYFQRKAKGTDDPDAPKKDKQGINATIQTLYRVIADSTMGEYDSVRQDYQRSHRYLIRPYDMRTLQTQSNSSSTATDQERYDDLRGAGLITKLYDYIYTGRNDQVLDFELVFNFNWYAALPLHAGVSGASTVAEIGAAPSKLQGRLESGSVSGVVSDVGQGLLDKIKASAPVSFSGDEHEAFGGGLFDFAGSVGNLVNSAQLAASDIQGTLTTGGLASDLETALSGVQPGMLNLPESLPGLNDITTTANLPDPGDLSNFLAAGITTPLSDASNITTAGKLQGMTDTPRVDTADNNEDVDKAQQGLRAVDYFTEDIAAGEIEKRVFIPSYIEAGPGDRSVDNADYSSSPGQNMLSALFEQANSPVSADLLNIDLKIKGDPYWIEPASVGRQTSPISAYDREIAAMEAGSDEAGMESANTTKAQTFFVFRSFTPQPFDADTGITPSSSQTRNALSGIYAVRTVTHNFSAGQFTQEIHAIRNVLLNLRGIDIDAPYVPNEPAEAGDTQSIVTATDLNASRLGAVDLANALTVEQQTIIAANQSVEDAESAAANALESHTTIIAEGADANVIAANDIDGGIGSGSGRIQAPVFGNIRVEDDGNG